MPQKLTPYTVSYDQENCKSKAGCEVNWQNVSAGPGSTALNVAGVARHLALTWTEQPTELYPMYLLAQTSYRAVSYILAQTSYSSTHQHQSWKCSRATPQNTAK